MTRSCVEGRYIVTVSSLDGHQYLLLQDSFFLVQVNPLAYV